MNPTVKMKIERLIALHKSILHHTTLLEKANESESEMALSPDLAETKHWMAGDYSAKAMSLIAISSMANEIDEISQWLFKYGHEEVTPPGFVMVLPAKNMFEGTIDQVES